MSTCIVPPPSDDVPEVKIRPHVRLMIGRGRWYSGKIRELIEGPVPVFDPTCERPPADRPTNPAPVR